MLELRPGASGESCQHGRLLGAAAEEFAADSQWRELASQSEGRSGPARTGATDKPRRNTGRGQGGQGGAEDESVSKRKRKGKEREFRGRGPVAIRAKGRDKRVRQRERQEERKRGGKEELLDLGAEAEDKYEGPLLGLGGGPQRSYEEVRGAPCGLSLNQGKTAYGRDAVLGQDRARCSTGAREDRPPDGAAERSDGAGVFPQFHVSPSGEALDSQFAGSPSASSNRCLGDFADSHLDDAPQTFDRSGEKKKMRGPSEVRECGRVGKLVGLPWGSCLPLVQSLLIKSSSKLKRSTARPSPRVTFSRYPPALTF